MSGRNDKEPSHKRKNDKQCEGRRYAVPSPRFITALADTCGISGLNEETISVLGEDASFRLREIIFNCTVHLRSSKEKKLRSYHVDRALPSGTERVYGYLSGGSANFLYAAEADAYVCHDNLIDVDLLALALSNDKYVQMGEVFIKGLWFLPDELSSPMQTPRDIPNDSPSLPPAAINYYNKIAAAILSTHDEVFSEAINDLARNPKIALVIPYFLNLIGEGIQGHLRGGLHCMRLLEMVRALTLNKHIYRDATVMVNELVTNLLLCALDPRIPSAACVVDDYELRATAADVLACVVKYWYRSNVKLLKDIVQKLGSVLLDGGSSLRSHYGALVTLCSLGFDALNYCLWPHLEQYLNFISTLNIERESKKLDGPLLDAAELMYREGMAFLKKPNECSISPERTVKIDQLLYSHFGDSLCAIRPSASLFTSVSSEGVGHVRSGEESLSASTIKDSVCNDFEMEYRNWTAIAKIPNRIVPLCDNINSTKPVSSQDQNRRSSGKVDIRSVFEILPIVKRYRPIHISSIRGVSPWPHRLRQRTLTWYGQFQDPSLYQIRSCQVNCVGKITRKRQQQRNSSLDFSAVL